MISDEITTIFAYFLAQRSHYSIKSFYVNFVFGRRVCVGNLQCCGIMTRSMIVVRPITIQYATNVSMKCVMHNFSNGMTLCRQMLWTGKPKTRTFFLSLHFAFDGFSTSNIRLLECRMHIQDINGACMRSSIVSTLYQHTRAYVQHNTNNHMPHYTQTHKTNESYCLFLLLTYGHYFNDRLRAFTFAHTLNNK